MEKDGRMTGLQEELLEIRIEDQEQCARNTSLEHTPPIPGGYPDTKRMTILLGNPPHERLLQTDENLPVTTSVVTLDEPSSPRWTQEGEMT